MKHCPETPTLADDTAFSGHVWIQEFPTGGPFRFRVAPSGYVRFASAERTYETLTAVPAPYRRAAQSIEARLDRETLQAATDAPGAVTFCGVATRNEGVEYDWSALPPFVGVDVWSDRRDQFLSPDTATSVFERLGLATLPAIEKEKPAAHTDFARFGDGTGFPPSAWRDGPALGILIRDKADGRAVAWAEARSAVASTPASRSAVDLAAAYATPERIERTCVALEADGHALTVDAIRDRLVADVAREAYATLFPDGEFVASLTTFRSAIGERIQHHQSTGN